MNTTTNTPGYDWYSRSNQALRAFKNGALTSSSAANDAHVTHIMMNLAAMISSLAGTCFRNSTLNYQTLLIITEVKTDKIKKSVLANLPGILNAQIECQSDKIKITVFN